MTRALAAALLAAALAPSALADSQETSVAARRQEIGISVGYGPGVKFAGSGLTDGHQVETLVMLPHWQIEAWQTRTTDRWWTARLELRVEGTAIVNFEPQTGTALGAGVYLRHHFLSAGDWVPYLHGGAGVIHLDYDLKDQADGFAFTPQLGVGAIRQLSRRLGLDLGVRFHHISNAFTQSPNHGIDTLQLLIGVSGRLD